MACGDGLLRRMGRKVGVELGTVALGELEAVLYQPLQALKRPQQDAFDLCRHLLGNVRVVHTGQGLVLGCQDELAAVKAVRTVVQGLKIAVADPYAMQPQSILEEQESRRELYSGLQRLTDREQTDLLYRYGFTDGKEHPLIGTAIYFHLTKSRAKKTEDNYLLTTKLFCGPTMLLDAL